MMIEEMDTRYTYLYNNIAFISDLIEYETIQRPYNYSGQRYEKTPRIEKFTYDHILILLTKAGQLHENGIFRRIEVLKDEMKVTTNEEYNQYVGSLSDKEKTDMIQTLLQDTYDYAIINKPKSAFEQLTAYVIINDTVAQSYEKSGQGK